MSNHTDAKNKKRTVNNNICYINSVPGPGNTISIWKRAFAYILGTFFYPKSL